MEFITEQISEILQENNTAQADLSNWLDHKPKSTTELFLTEGWSGKLDFAILKQKGFYNIDTIEIHKGSITHIDNLPLQLKRFVCIDNLLTVLDKLPKYLHILDVHNNYLQSIEIKNLNVLETLNVSNNQLTELAPLGEHLTTIECDRNHLATLDLLPCKHLVKLNCSNNPLLVVKDPPATLVDFTMDNNPITEIQRQYKTGDPKDTDKKVDYTEGLRLYFKMKAEYEDKETKMKQNAFKKEALKREGRKRASAVKAPCINCKRKVGTIFSVKDKKYRAVCGDVRNPCSLNIQIFAGHTANHTQTLYQFKEQLEELKEMIIRQKMDTLFHYLDEKQSATIFKNHLEEYQSTNTLFKEMLETHQELYDSPYNRELIQRKEVEIYEILRHMRELLAEYQKKVDIETIELEEEESAITIMQTVIESYRELSNQWKTLRMLKYAIVEMDCKKMGENINSYYLCTLQKFMVSPLSFDYQYGENPHIVKFTMTK